MKPPSSQHSPQRRTLFAIILALVPILFFLGLELLLRLFNLFPQEPFLLQTTKGGKEHYQLNQWVAKRYFDSRKVTVPGMAPELFAKHKTKNTFRIFCLGGSTTAGFPFDCQVPFPKQLRYLLTRSHPEYQVEVINAGISAVNSFTVLDLLPEILDCEPDAILVYMGHNEFFGAYGSASTIYIGQNDGFIRFYLKLQKLRLVQMLKRALSRISRVPAKPSGRTLMTEVIGDKAVAIDSEKYAATMRSFENNLRFILHQCAENRVPVFIGTVFSNVRDLPPLGSLGSAALSNQAVREAITIGDSMFAQQFYAPARASYQIAFSHDSTSALLWYKFGKTLAAMGDSTGAARFLYGAKDRDLIRFRASEEVNRIIASVARETGGRLVDMHEAFRRRSPQRLIGKNLICDHLHPTPAGYYLMARTFYGAIAEAGLLRNRDVSFSPGDRPYFVTDLDWDIGLLKIFELVHRWPFEEKPVTFADYRPYGDSAAARIAADYLLRENVWSRAHYKMAEEFIARREFEKARQEYLAVSLFVPDDSYPYQEIARTYEMEQAWDQREAYLKLALPHSSQKGMLNYQIAFAQWKQGKLDDACRSMTAALNHPDLDRKQKQNARYYLAGFYFDARDFDRARMVLQDILREDPNFMPARAFLQRIEKEAK